MMGLSRVAQVKAAVGPFHAQNVFFLHGAKHHIGELAARHVAQVQFDTGLAGLRLWCAGHGVGAAVAVFEQHFDVLAGVILEGFGRRNLQAQYDHIVRHLLQAAHPGGQLLDGQGPLCGDLFGFQLHVGKRLCAAGQHQSLRLFFRTQCFIEVRAMLHAAAEFPALAGAAGAVLAAIRHGNALTDTCGQDGLLSLHGKGHPAGFHANAVGHVRALRSCSGHRWPLHRGPAHHRALRGCAGPGWAACGIHRPVSRSI